MGLFTFALFFTTGRPVPREFVPADQLDFSSICEDIGVAGPIQGTIWRRYSNGGRCFLEFTKLKGDSYVIIPSDDIVATVTDSISMEKLGVFRVTLDNYNSDGSFQISPDRQYLFSVMKGKLHAWRLQRSKLAIDQIWSDIDVPDSAGGIFLRFSPDDRHLLIYSNERCVHYDLLQRRTIAAFARPAMGSSDPCFFDSQGRPRVLLYFIDPGTLWELIKQKVAATLVCFDDVGSRHSDIIYVAGKPALATIFHNSRNLYIHSLDDGRLLQTYSIPTGMDETGQFDSNRHFLILSSSWRFPLVHAAEGWNSQLDKWLSVRFPERERLVLLDLHSGKQWFDFLGDSRCTLSDDATQPKTIADEGYYVYDVPPRWQYFTPWAWTSLGAWLSLVTIWWRLRKRRLSMAATA
jgi:hypothetical protein